MSSRRWTRILKPSGGIGHASTGATPAGCSAYSPLFGALSSRSALSEVNPRQTEPAASNRMLEAPGGTITTDPAATSTVSPPAVTWQGVNSAHRKYSSALSARSSTEPATTSEYAVTMLAARTHHVEADPSVSCAGVPWRWA